MSAKPGKQNKSKTSAISSTSESASESAGANTNTNTNTNTSTNSKHKKTKMSPNIDMMEVSSNQEGGQGAGSSSSSSSSKDALSHPPLKSPAGKVVQSAENNRPKHKGQGAAFGINGSTAGQTEPLNPWASVMLTDFYEITMVYAFWRGGRHNEFSVFDAFFRKNPFHGEYTIFAGLEEVMRLVNSFKFTPSDVDYLRTQIPDAENEFFEWIGQIDCSEVKIHALTEGTVCFPRIPVIRVEGPLAVCQLLETPLLNLCNFPSLIATNAARMRQAAGADKMLLEFGLRRAQGPDGGMSASRYSYIGGFDGTSNVAAGKAFDIAIRGTHAHSFVCSFLGPQSLSTRELHGVDLWDLSMEYRKKLGFMHTNEGELAAFVSYAQAFPDTFLALVDTYDTLKSGVPNFLCVALALKRLGHEPRGIRLDSGDLAYLSMSAREKFLEVAEKFQVDFTKLQIFASNDINETVLMALDEQGHSIDAFGIGTNLVTCQAQPALGMVYKLVQIGSEPAIKLSNEFEKMTLPGKKNAYRIVGSMGEALCDVMLTEDEQPPVAGKRILCRHPFVERKRAYVTPAFVIDLLQMVWDGPRGRIAPAPSMREIKTYVNEQMKLIRSDHKRALNPAPYKVSVSDKLYEFIHTLWMQKVAIPELA